ncbi:MAG TPA: WD40 repeat domain-containing protein [Chthonomonadales bacterium]|nr:WD40 repeat domain-containing protein [Chthonomonadales bacterium]
MSRRGALGWILGGAAAAAIAGGAGLFIYSKLHTPAHSLSVLQGYSAPVTSVSWSPDGSLLASASRDKTAKVWQASNGQLVTTYSRHTAAILSIAWGQGPGGPLLASGGEDKTVQVWNTSAVRYRLFPRLAAPVSSLAWSLDSSYILAGTQGGGAHALLLSNGTITSSIGRLNIHALAFSPDGSYIALALQSGFVTVVTVQEPHKTVFSTGQASPALCLAWSPDGSRLAVGFANNAAEVYNFSPGSSTNRSILRSLPHNGAVNGIAWEPSNGATPRLATAAGDGTLNIWDMADSAATTYNGYGPAMLSVAWSSGGLATGDANNTVILWQVVE